MPLPPWQRVDGLDGRLGFNRQIRVSVKGSALAARFWIEPVIERLLAEPDRQASPLFERVVILSPVAGLGLADFFFLAEKLYRARFIRNYSF